MAQAVCSLVAQRRWVLTGTPIINSPKDLGSILTFLRICRPLDNEDFYKRMVLRPLKDGDPSGAELLRALMSHVCIRRTKEELYDAVEELSKERVGSLLERHGGVQSAVVQSNILSLLTRLRQLALHPGLVPPNYVEKLRATMENEDAAAAPAIAITPADRVRLQGLLAQAIEDNEECPVCFGILAEPRITTYLITSDEVISITEVIARDPKCPMDRRAITMGDLIEPPPPTELTQAPVRREEDEDLTGIRAGSSAKIDQLVNLLKLTPTTEKSLVFSQFTSFLDKIAETLEKEGIPYVRFDGKMSAKRRQETIAQFSVPVQENSVTPAPEVAQMTPTASQETASQTTSSRPRRARKTRSTTTVLDGGDEIEIVENGGDDDYVMNDEVDDDDDDFIDDEDDESSKRKKKGKAKGKGKAIPKASASVSRGPVFAGPNPKVMLISLKAGALGLNLTVANNVYLMDPWWQEGIESQAIDRCNRIGQTKPVHVYQLIAENTVEAKVIEIQEKKNKLIKHAFSGIKSKETQRQKKEARLQELIELFGMQHQQAAAQEHTQDSSQATLDGWRGSS
ncbi:hypothetical protein EIP86_001347 [Pleurotus ostreatoroseus]|nr:hypothetical protein EIP86_001347 [Pleurotus ostreatoroseus]